jgi:hypothetical protein
MLFQCCSPNLIYSHYQSGQILLLGVLVLFWFDCFVFETGLLAWNFWAQVILLTQSPEYLDYQHMPPIPGYLTFQCSFKKRNEMKKIKKAMKKEVNKKKEKNRAEDITLNGSLKEKK